MRTFIDTLKLGGLINPLAMSPGIVEEVLQILVWTLETIHWLEQG